MKKSYWLVILLIIIFGMFFGYESKNYTEKEVTSVDKKIEQIEEQISTNKVQLLQNDYNNTDIKAILTIDNIANFSYPVAQASNNDYYLNHNYDKEYNAYGAIYADYRVDLDNSKKILIFGHSSTKRDVPFNKLESYEKKDYYSEHKYINLETETNTYRYEIFSVYVETSDFTYMNMNFDSDKDWFLHILQMQKKSLYEIDVDLNIDDDILILQTCSNNSAYRKYSKKYLLIVSRRVK